MEILGIKIPIQAELSAGKKKMEFRRGKKKAKFEFSGVATAPEGKRKKGGEWE